MFYMSGFNQNISRWDIGNVRYMNGIFRHSKFRNLVGNWKLRTKYPLESAIDSELLYLFSDKWVEYEEGD